MSSFKLQFQDGCIQETNIYANRYKLLQNIIMLCHMIKWILLCMDQLVQRGAVPELITLFQHGHLLKHKHIIRGYFVLWRMCRLRGAGSAVTHTMQQLAMRAGSEPTREYPTWWTRMTVIHHIINNLSWRSWTEEDSGGSYMCSYI